MAVLLLLSGCAPVSAEPGATADTRAVTAAQVASNTRTRHGDAPAGVAAADTAGPPAGRASSGATSAAVRKYRSVRRHETLAPPARVSIPSLGVSSDLQLLGLADDGSIEVPDEWQQAGWYRDGPKPGQVGPAVILGHVDSRQGPAIFHRVHELKPGDRVVVDLADGSVATFVVDRTERHAKTRFPTDEVYLTTLEPTLRLVTCGGAFDASVRSYRDNVVVFATLDELTPAS